MEHLQKCHIHLVSSTKNYGLFASYNNDDICLCIRQLLILDPPGPSSVSSCFNSQVMAMPIHLGTNPRNYGKHYYYCWSLEDFKLLLHILLLINRYKNRHTSSFVRKNIKGRTKVKFFTSFGGKGRKINSSPLTPNPFTNNHATFHT